MLNVLLLLFQFNLLLIVILVAFYLLFQLGSRSKFKPLLVTLFAASLVYPISIIVKILIEYGTSLVFLALVAMALVSLPNRVKWRENDTTHYD